MTIAKITCPFFSGGSRKTCSTPRHEDLLRHIESRAEGERSLRGACIRRREISGVVAPEVGDGGGAEKAPQPHETGCGHLEQ